MELCTIANTTKSQIPRLPYNEIKDSILGTQYAVSLVFVGEKRAQRINKTWRKKTYTPNVLAFEIAPHLGEVYICIPVATREATEYGHTPLKHIGFLFIHALLHLKGHVHGDTMEKAEARYMTDFKLA
jgi:probable rRNA maturation factor